MGSGREFIRADRPLLVGRLNELQLIEQLLDGLEVGTGNLVLIGGETGIGKTRLVEEASRLAWERGALVLSGICFDLTTTRPLGPWFDLLDSYQPYQRLPAVPRIVAEARTQSSQELQSDLINAFWSFISAINEIQPLVVVLEDWHMADAASLELLRIFARQLPSRRILVLLTYREEDLSIERPIYRILPNFVREARAVRIDLLRLDQAAVRTLVHSRYALEPADEDRLVEQLYRSSNGNPLFIVELLRLLELDLLLSVSNGVWMLGDLEALPVPPLIHQLVDIRLAALGDQAREYLELAAIIGQQVPLELWQTVCGISERELSEVIRCARDAHLIEQQVDSSQLRFSHTIVQEALYEGIVLPLRREWHRQVAEALATMPSASPEVVAFHFTQAGDARAGDWLVRAGDHERAARFFNAAFDHYEAALRLSDVDHELLRSRGWLLFRIADTRVWIDEHQGLIYLDEVQEIADETGDAALSVATCWLRGKLRTLIGEDGYPDLESAARQLSQLPDTEREKLSGLLVRDYHISAAEDFIQRALANYSAHYGRYRESLKQANQYLHARTGREERPPDHHIASALAVSHAALGNPNEARLAFQTAIEINERKGHYADQANIARMALRDVALVYYTDWLPERDELVDLVVTAYRKSLKQGAVSPASPRWGTLPVMLLEGEWDEAQAIVDDLSERGGHWSRAVVTASGQLARFLGSPAQAWNFVEPAFPDGPDTDPYNQYYDVLLQLQRLAAELALDESEVELARQWLNANGRWIDWSGRVQGRAELHLLWARYNDLVGDEQAARGSAARALDYSHNPRQPLALLAAHHLLARLAVKSGDLGDAAYHAEQALDLAQRCRAVYWKAQVLIVQAELDLFARRRDRARSALREARTICNQLRALPLLDEISTLFRRTQPGQSQRMPGRILTARETEVLELIAEGLTSAEVADLLSISPRTVNQHLGSIFAKLEVNNRAAAIQAALTKGLLRQ